ncbi:MAG: ATP-binding protein [Bacteroides graminisolvens]|nr:ATP-binding protein [Bacteroides graminisolvens]
MTFDLIYEGDSFISMSPGKQAFVILKLLLEFSDKTCPILIDQPEDSLDNRAIYKDLVKYLRKKKTERQIIIVTHNPNVVVGADSELVIVANQNGKDTPNNNNMKFQYASGSLEDTFTQDDENLHILDKQGIREHVCEILEGGKEAFEKREQKYGFII